MNAKEFSILIEKYKKGKCSLREKELLENYLESFQNNPGEWNEKEMGEHKIIEKRIYSEILRNINKGENRNCIIRMLSFPSLLKRAASIIFFIILGSGVLYVSGIFHQKTDSAGWNEKVTLSGEKYAITLSDGSKITLNADSKIKFPDHFDGTVREVYLEGEAYFEVRHNSKLPFIVKTGKLAITDLGTKFDLSAYPDNKTSAVSLLEGKVKVSRSENGEIDKIAVLKPKQKLLFDSENNITLFVAFDSLDAVGWKDNIYKFENEPLGNVLLKLERAYNVKFKLNDQSVLEQKITVKFEKDSLQTVVNVIKNLTGLDYKIVKGNNTKEVLYFRNNNY